MKHKLHFRTLVIALLSMIVLQSSVFSQSTIDGFFYSPSLNATKMVDIYLPPGYNSNPDLHYPVIYFLHGWGGNQNFLSTVTSYATQKINSGAIDPCIIVCASNYTAPFDGSMYMNSPVHGNYEDYMIDDLITWLDSTYRTVPSKNYRSLFGHSMGAYGAWRYGTLHKDKFVALAAHAAPANMEVIIDEFENEIESEVSGPPYFYNYSTYGNFKKMMFLGAGVWSPNQNTPQTYINPQVVEYPFNQQGNLIDSVFNKWDAHQVTSLVHNLSAADSIGILFGCGSNDDLYFNIANLALKDTLDALNIDYTYYNHTGGHSLPTGFKTAALDFLDSKMSSPMIPAEPCIDPSNLLATNIMPFSADLSWDENGNATSWEIMIDVQGFDPNNGVALPVANIPFAISGLLDNTAYDWYVRADCGDSNYSNWVGPNTFSTSVSETTQTIQLFAGWNIHSFVVTPDDMNMLNVHADLINSGQLVKIIDGDGNFVQEIPGIGWMNTIGDMNANEGYYLKVTSSTQLDITGQLSNSLCEIPLNTGWNIMGYPMLESQNALSAVQSLIDNNLLEKVMNEAGEAIIELPGIGWINTIGNFEPGEGYYIKVTANTTLTLNCPQRSNIIPDIEPALETVFFDNPNPKNPYKPMNIIVNNIKVNNLTIMEGDEIAVYDNDIIVGTGVITSLDGTLCTIIVAAMDDPTTEEVDGFTEGNQISFKYLNAQLENPIEMIAEAVSGTNEFQALGTYVVSLQSDLAYVVEKNASNIEINTYPNPVNNKMSIDYAIPHGQVYLGIVDLNGMRVKEIMNEFREEGDHTSSIDVSNLSQGFYVLQVRVVSNGMIYTKFHKFVKM